MGKLSSPLLLSRRLCASKGLLGPDLAVHAQHEGDQNQGCGLHGRPWPTGALLQWLGAFLGLRMLHQLLDPAHAAGLSSMLAEDVVG